MSEEEESKRGDVEPNESLPGSVSDQNAEEEQPGHEGHAQGKGSSSDEKPTGGESSEGSQSTGNPANAG